MAKQVGKKFVWVIKNFSSLQCVKCYSAPVLIGDCKWRLYAHSKGRNVGDFSLYLQVVDLESLPSGWRRYVKYRLTIVPQDTKNRVQRGDLCWFDKVRRSWGFSSMIPLSVLHEEFLVNGEVIIVAKVDVLEVIGTLDASEKSKESSSPLKKCNIRISESYLVVQDVVFSYKSL